MANQKDMHPKKSGEANSNKETGDDNGFFTDDENSLQTKEEYEKDKSNHPGKDEKVVPLSPSTSETLGDKITVNSDNEDMVTPVKDDNPDSYNNEDDQAH